MTKVPKIDELIDDYKSFQKQLKSEVVARLLRKGLVVNWTVSDFAGFLSVMANLHAQTKNWKWPSDSLYMSLDPQSLTTLVLCLEEKRLQK